MSETVSRPGGVTLVAVLTWISGLLSILGGIALILLRDNTEVRRELEGSSSQTVVIIGLVYLIIGIVTIAVANGLLRGSRLSRFLVTVLMVLEVAAGIWAVINLGSRGVGAWLNIGIGVVVVLLLWGGRAGAFFRSR